MRQCGMPNCSFRTLLVALGLMGVFAPSAAATRKPDQDAAAPVLCFESWWHAQGELIREHRDSPRALLPLRMLTEMALTAKDPTEIGRMLDGIRGDDRTHPLISAELDYRLVGWDLRRGDVAAASARLDRLGIAREYLISGPLEPGANPAAAWKGLVDSPRDEGAWRRIETGPRGVLPLHFLLHPAQNRSAAVALHVYAPRRLSVALRYGADDHASVWLDGVRIAAPEGQHEMAFDQHATLLTLSSGWHLIGFVVDQLDGPWNLIARLTTPEGGPLPAGVRIGLPAQMQELPPLGKRAPGTTGEKESRRGRRRRGKQRLVTLTGWLEELAREDPTLHADLAVDLAARQLPDREHARALALARESAFQYPRTLRALWSRVLVESDPSFVRQSLERILELEPKSPVALRRLAQYHLRFQQTDRALEYARQGADACPAEDPYIEGWVEVARYMDGFPHGASTMLAALTKRFPRQPSLLERLASLYEQERLPASARAAYEAYLAQNRTDGAARAALIHLESAAGRTEEVTRLLEEAIELEPLVLAWRSRLAEHYLAIGEAALSYESLLPARRLAPEDPALLQLEGEIWLAEGNVQRTRELWQRVIDVSGESSGLSDRLAALTGTRERFGSEWTVSLDEARALAASAEFEGDPPVVVLSRTDAFKIKANGMSARFHQVISQVRDPEGGAFTRGFSLTYSPHLQRATILDARLVREDGSVILASRRERPLLPDPELRMWYDSRVLELSFPRLAKGDLIEIRYRLTDSGSTNPITPGYFGEVVVEGNPVPVISSRLVIEAPESLPVRYQLVNLSGEPEVKHSKQGGTLVTEVDLPALPAYPDAPYAPPATLRVPYAVVGSVSSWEELGRMYAGLLRPQLRPTEDLKRIVREATLGARSRREKIDALYQWVIENTRYVALELGIHAIKPYDVGSVLRRHYGDCKDKASLLVAMLAEVGVPAQVALVRSRDRGEIDTTVPVFSAFDHALVHVPEEDLWLDGTVLNYGPQELPMADRDALALVVDTSGQGSGWLAHTPSARPEDAFTGRNEELRLDPDGDATFKIRITAKGEAAALERHYFRLAERQVAILETRLRSKNVDIVVDQADFKNLALTDKTVRYGFRGSVKHFARQEGDALNCPLTLFPPPLPSDAPPSGRDVALWLPPPFHWRAEIQLFLPAGAEWAEGPESSVTDSPWGTLKVEIKRLRSGAKITIDTVFRGGVVPPGRIEEFAHFVQQARQVLGQRLVMRRKEASR